MPFHFFSPSLAANWLKKIDQGVYRKFVSKPSRNLSVHNLKSCSAASPAIREVRLHSQVVYGVGSVQEEGEVGGIHLYIISELLVVFISTYSLAMSVKASEGAGE